MAMADRRPLLLSKITIEVYFDTLLHSGLTNRFYDIVIKDREWNVIIQNYYKYLIYSLTYTRSSLPKECSQTWNGNHTHQPWNRKAVYCQLCQQPGEWFNTYFLFYFIYRDRYPNKYYRLTKHHYIPIRRTLQIKYHET